MARILLHTFGAMGDLHPFLALALRLAERGHDVSFGAPESMHEQIRAAGFTAVAVGPRHSLQDVPKNPVAFRRRIERIPGFAHAALSNRWLVGTMIAPHARRVEDELAAALAGRDLLVSHGAHPVGAVAARRAGVRFASLVLSPGTLASSRAAPIGWPNLGSVGNRLLWRLTSAVAERGAEPIHAMRAEAGLARARHLLFGDSLSSELILLAVPEALWSAPPDAPAHLRQVGFLQWDGADSGLDPTLEAFLAAGRPPVGVTLGSFTYAAPPDFFRRFAEGARLAGERAILIDPRLAHTRGEHTADAAAGGSASIAVAFAPYSKLLPRLRAHVHHGGIGSTVDALLAGIPQIVVPQTLDQFQQAALVRRRGIGIQLATGAAPDRIAQAIRRVVDDSGIAARADKLAGRARSEGGAPLAADLLEKFLRGERLPNLL